MSSKQEKHNQKTQKEIKDIINSKKISKLKKKNNRLINENEKLIKENERLIKENERLHNNNLTYEQSVNIMTCSNNTDANTNKLLQDYHNQEEIHIDIELIANNNDWNEIGCFFWPKCDNLNSNSEYPEKWVIPVLIIEEINLKINLLQREYPEFFQYIMTHYGGIKFRSIDNEYNKANIYLFYEFIEFNYILNFKEYDNKIFRLFNDGKLFNIEDIPGTFDNEIIKFYESKKIIHKKKPSLEFLGRNIYYMNQEYERFLSVVKPIHDLYDKYVCYADNHQNLELLFRSHPHLYQKRLSKRTNK